MASDQQYAQWDADLISEFVIEINLLIGTQFGTRPTSCDFHSKNLIAGITTNIGQKVTRIRDIKLVFNTYDIDSFKKNANQIVFPFTNQQFTFSGFKTIEFNQVIFTNMEWWKNPVGSHFYVRAIINFVGMFLDSSIVFRDCNINQKDFAISFIIEDMFNLEISNLRYNSNENLNQMAGFPLFIQKQVIQQKLSNDIQQKLSH